MRLQPQWNSYNPVASEFFSQPYLILAQLQIIYKPLETPPKRASCHLRRGVPEEREASELSTQRLSYYLGQPQRRALNGLKLVRYRGKFKKKWYLGVHLGLIDISMVITTLSWDHLWLCFYNIIYNWNFTSKHVANKRCDNLWTCGCAIKRK